MDVRLHASLHDHAHHTHSHVHIVPSTLYRTRMAMARVSWSKPPFAVPYGTESGIARYDCRDATLTILPHTPRAAMPGTSARARKKGTARCKSRSHAVWTAGKVSTRRLPAATASLR